VEDHHRLLRLGRGNEGRPAAPAITVPPTSFSTSRLSCSPPLTCASVEWPRFLVECRAFFRRSGTSERQCGLTCPNPNFEKHQYECRVRSRSERVSMGKASFFPKSHAFFGAQKYAGGGARKGRRPPLRHGRQRVARGHIALGEAGKRLGKRRPWPKLSAGHAGHSAQIALRSSSGAAARMAGRPAQRRAAVTHAIE